MNIVINKNQEKKSGVYIITNTLNNKVYIGSTISGFKKRVKEHIYELIKNRHHSNHLQKAYNKYGQSVFQFSILEICNKEDIIEREQFYLDKYKSYQRKNGYNILEKAYNVFGLGEGGLVGCSNLAECVCPLLPNPCYTLARLIKR